MRKSVASSVVCLFVTSLAVVSASAGSRRNGGGGGAEVLIGSYHCGGSQDEISSWMTFDATGDVLSDSLSFYQQDSAAGDPGEHCEAAASQMRAALGDHCKAGATRARADESGESRDFEFMCHASRSQIIGTIAETTGALLESGL